MGRHSAQRHGSPIRRWGRDFVLAHLVGAAMLVGSAWIGVDKLTHQHYCSGVLMSDGDRCKWVGRNSEVFVPEADAVNSAGVRIGSSLTEQVSQNQIYGAVFLSAAVVLFVFYVFVIVRNWPRRNHDGRR